MHWEICFNHLECKNLTHRLGKNRLHTGCGPWVTVYTLCPVLHYFIYLIDGIHLYLTFCGLFIWVYYTLTIRMKNFSARECFIVFFIEVSQPPLGKAHHTVDGEGSVSWPVDRLALEDPETAK